MVTEVVFSDLLLQQALVGSSPNARVLSYFKHAVSSQVSLTPCLVSCLEMSHL